MSLHQGWGWGPLQTTSHIHIRHRQTVWAHWYAVHRHTAAAILLSSAHPTWLKLWGSVSLVESKWCQVNTSWLRIMATSNCFPIHIRHRQTVWAHWYAAHWHTVAALHSYTHLTWLRLGFWVTCGGQNDVNTLWLRLRATSNCFLIHIRHRQTVWAHWYAVHWHTVAALHSYTHHTWLRVWGSGSFVEVKMMSLHQGWGWGPPQTTSLIHMKHI